MPSYKIKFYLALIKHGKYIIHARYTSISEKNMRIYAVHRHTYHIKFFVLICPNFVQNAVSIMRKKIQI
jgi:hypothetical protein